MTNADILAQLRADVAAANAPEEHDYDETLETCKACQGAKERGRARVRIAALDGPALLEALMRHMPKHTHHADFCDEKPCVCGYDAVAESAKVLEVPDA